MWKIFSLLFVLGVVSIIACAMISDDSSAEVTSGTTGGCTWTLDGTKLTISGDGVIADSYSESLPWKESITEVVIENGVTSIGDGAFRGCTSLTKIDVDSSNPNYCSYDDVLFTKDKAELIQCSGVRVAVIWCQVLC